MRTLAWIISGLLAGALVGRSLRGTGYGFSGSLVIGTAGGIVGGWFFNRAFGITTTNQLGPHCWEAQRSCWRSARSIVLPPR